MASEVLEGWKRLRLGDLADIVMGQSPPGKTVLEWNGSVYGSNGLPFVQGNAEFGDKCPRPVKWCDKPIKVAEAGDFLISVRAPVGQTNRVDGRLSIGRGLAAIRFTRAYRLFGWHALNQNKHFLRRISQGSTFKAIGRGELSSLVVFLPPLCEQRAIAAVLDSIDGAIERTEALIAAAEDLRESLRHELLTRGIPGWHSEYKEIPRLGTVPAAWEVVRLGDVSEVNGRSWKSKDDSPILYLDLTTVAAPGVLLPPKNLCSSKAPSRARRMVKAGDILISTVRPNLRGFARITTAPKNLVASTGFSVVTPLSGADQSFLYHLIMGQRFARYLTKSATGQAYPAVRPSDVTAFPFPNPSLPEQQAIARVLDSVDNAVEQLNRERDARANVKKSVAEALLTGRVRVGEGMSA